MKAIKIIISVLVLASLCSLLSCGKPYGKLLDTKKDGDFSFDLYGKDGNILRIEVKKGDTEVCALTCNGKDFKTVDINFDGKKDIMLASNEKSGGYYQCFIYQPNTGIFTRNTNFDNMQHPVLDEENKKIICKINTKELIKEATNEAYKEVRGSSVWYWKNGILSQFSEEGIEYYTDSGLYCVYKATEVKGEFTRSGADEIWFLSHEDLVAAGYTWEK